MSNQGNPHKKRCLVLVILLLASQVISFSQDIHFSQFFEAPLLRNPSLAGIYSGDIRIQGVYRDQWNSFTNAYRTGSINAEYKMPVGKGNDFMTTGIQALFDRSGTVGLTSAHVLPALNYHKSLSNSKLMFLSLGFMGGMVRKSVDVSKMTTDNQYGPGGFDPTAPTGENFIAPNFTSWDANVGMSFNTSFGKEQSNNMFVGAAFHHLNRPKNSFYRDPNIELHPKYVFSTGIKLKIDDFSSFTIHADHSIQGSFSETVGGALYAHVLGDDPVDPPYTLYAGAFLRFKDALIPVIKMDMKSISVAISYDLNVSPLKTASRGRGGFELSISYIAFLDRYNSSRDKVLCPKL